MALILYTFTVVSSFIVTCLMTLVIVLAAVGTSLGIRRRYIDVLLQIFEFGRDRIHSYRVLERDKHRQEENHDGSGDEGLPDEDALTDSSQEPDQDEDIDKVIDRDITISTTEGIKIPSNRPDYDLSWKREFHVSDVMYFAKCGAESIIQDDVTHRFSAEDLKSWNLLTRTDKGYHFISVRLTVLWCLGCFVRYTILLPFRMILCFIGISWLIISTFLIGYIPRGSFKKTLNRVFSLMSHRILCRAMSALVTFHNPENRPSHGVCVANHTSPLDVIILSSDNCYAMVNHNPNPYKIIPTDIRVGQQHGGFLGMIQRALSRATSHIWFERSEVKDRHIVSKRMSEHVVDKNKLPILIFPEGTCINNTSVMMFKKGGFEVSPVVYPVAVKYDSRFGDAFWNSSKESMIHHIFNIMTSWALVVEVWYLPPIERQPDEDAITFANRTKSIIAKKGGLVDLDWDGQLKRMKVKDTLKSIPQRDYSKILKVD